MRFSALRHTTLGFALETRLRRARHLAPSALHHWHASPSPSPSLVSVRGLLHALEKRPPPARASVKGHPDTHAHKLPILRRLRHSLDAGDVVQALAEARELAAIDMSDAEAYVLFLELCAFVNADALAALRRTSRRDVIVHVSCRPRIDRAFASRQSFAAAEGPDLSQIVVVGDDEARRFGFDAGAGVLTVPASDRYEHLPSKVVATMAFLALAGGIDGVLKVDDDHRLHSEREMMRGFRWLRRDRPLQIGTLSRIGILGLHPRAWHFGKTSDAVLNATPYTLPATTRWANGANGYFLNGAALRLMLWSWVYFPEYIRIALYEDITVSDLIERQGGLIGSMRMERAITAVDSY